VQVECFLSPTAGRRFDYGFVAYIELVSTQYPEHTRARPACGSQFTFRAVNEAPDKELDNVTRLLEVLVIFQHVAVLDAKTPKPYASL